LQVNESSYFASPAGLVSILGSAAYILPATQEADMLYGGVSAEGPSGVFQNNRFKIQMVSAGPDNPGNFSMYRFSGAGALQVGLQSIGGSVSVNEVTIPIGGHEHWNWGFSAPGTYTFEFQGLGVKSADLSIFETSRELFTFNVIPEPSSGSLLLIGLMGWFAARKRVVLKE
jgi:surface-anchored protein